MGGYPRAFARHPGATDDRAPAGVGEARVAGPLLAFVQRGRARTPTPGADGGLEHARVASAVHVGDWLEGAGGSSLGATASVRAGAAGNGVPTITRTLLSMVTFISYATGSSGAP